MKKQGLKKILIIAVVLLLVGGAVAAYMLLSDTSETISPIKQDVVSSLKVTGEIKGSGEQTIYAEVSSKISESKVKAGSIVKKGDLLIEYDLNSLESEVKLAEDAYNCAEGSLLDAKDSNQAYSLLFNNASTELANLLKEYDSLIAQEKELLLKQEQNGQNINSTVQSLESLAEQAGRNFETKNAELEGENTVLQSLLTSETYLIYQSNLNKIESLRNEVINLEERLKKAENPEDTQNTEDPEAIKEEISVKNAQISALENYNKGNDSEDPNSALIPVVLNSINEHQTKIAALQNEASGYSTTMTNIQTQISQVGTSALTNDEYATLLNVQAKLDELSGKIEAARSSQASAKEGKETSAGMAEYEAVLTQSEDELNLAKNNLTLAETGVLAPEDGIIIEKYIDTGAFVEKGQELFLIQYTDTYVVWATVSKYDISKIKLDEEAEIKVGDSVYKGHVSAINPIAQTDASGKAKICVQVTFDETDENIILGLEADVTIYTGNSSDAVTLPIEAVFSDDEGDYVYLISGNESVKTYVETGYSDSDYIEILSGITMEDEVNLGQ